MAYQKIFLKLILTALSIFFATNRGYGAASPWQNYEGAKIRVLLKNKASDQASKNYIGAVEVNLNKDWKTYWKNPGASGVAALIKLNSAAAKIYQANLAFPAPENYQNGLDWANIYKGSVLLPITINKKSNSKDSSIEGQIMLGLCKDLCVPVKVDFSFSDANLSSTAEEDKIITQAFAKLPKLPSEDFKIISAKMSADKSLTIRVSHPSSEMPAEIFLDSKDSYISKPIITSHGKNYTEFTAKCDSMLPHGAKIFYTVKLGNNSIADYLSL